MQDWSVFHNTCCIHLSSSFLSATLQECAGGQGGVFKLKRKAALLLLVEGKTISISYARSLHLTWGYLPFLQGLSVQHNTQGSEPRVSSSFQVLAELRFL